MESKDVGEKGEGGWWGKAQRHAFYASDPPLTTLFVIRTVICCDWSNSFPDPMDTRISTTILPTVSCLHFYFWLNGTGSSLFLKPTMDANNYA